MTDDIVTRLREEADSWCHDSAVRVFLEAADEIERLRRWAEYEHAGYCPCAGGDPECIKRAYNGWKKMFND